VNKRNCKGGRKEGRKEMKRKFHSSARKERDDVIIKNTRK
jgi:hypothetical protein